jgi:hypothetical protein
VHFRLGPDRTLRRHTRQRREQAFFHLAELP